MIGALKRLGLVLFGLVLALVLIEGVLQVGAFVAQTRVRAGQPGSAGAGDLRVLCLGDSNTYGLYLDRDESYPAQLEALWNATHDAPSLEVLNLGMPGTNSSWLVRESDRLLETFAPDLVILMVGANDFWTQPVELDPERPAVSGFWRRTRIGRALYLARRGRTARELEVVGADGITDSRVPMPAETPRIEGGTFDVRYGDEEFTMTFEAGDEGLAGDDAGLRANLKTLTERVRESGARVLLMSYPSRQHVYGRASGILAEVAQELDAPFVDHAAAFASRCPEEPCPALLFPDGHANADGYHLVAEGLAAWLDASPLVGAP